MATSTQAEHAQAWEPEGATEDSEMLLQERLKAIIADLESEAMERVGKRDAIENRWLTDLQQFHGKYDASILKDLTEQKRSQLFINQTRQKTNACEARLSDMLFPTDDKNWGIEPTPVPELTVGAEQAAMQASKLKQRAAEQPEDPRIRQEADAAMSESEAIHARLEEARSRCRSMDAEIEDVLIECKYNIESRDVIRDACRLGTGVMKGPVIDGKTRRSWSQAEDGTYQMGVINDDRPAYWRVDPWNFFPDMDDCESVYERHLYNKKELRGLAKKPGFNKDAIRRVLRQDPQTSLPTYVSELRSITEAYHDTSTSRYHVWEYNGPLTAERLQLLATSAGKHDMIEDLELQDADPLQELNVTIWFCQGEALKFGIHQLDSEDPIYSVFNLEKDEASIFGFGIPYLMRDSQSALNAAWRTMMDNAGLASGPQIVYDPDVVEPVDGVEVIVPRKVWKRKAGAALNAKPFETFDIPMHQAEMANIIELAKQNIDDETNIPVIAQGEQGSHVTQTAHGMNILMNSVNVVFRRIVKNWDDEMTTPNIRRCYDFLMQFSPKEHIKGDYEVDARGTSVLLVKEMQSANLMGFLMNFGAHPILGKYLKEEGLPALRRLVQTLMIPADEVIKSNEEIAEDQARAAEAPPDPNPDILRIEADMNRAQMDNETKLELAYVNRETEMIKLAQNSNLKLEEIMAMLEGKRMDHASKERMFTAEAAIEQRMMKEGAESQGSGGNFSYESGGNGGK